MFKHLLTVSLLALPLSCTPDLSTDEGVLRALNATRDSRLDKDDLCVKRAEELPAVVLVGYFAHDRGCMPGEIFIDGKKHEYDHASRPALHKLGWKQADASGRVALAVRWTKLGLMAFQGTVLSAEPEGFGRPGFASINGRTDGGNTHVTLWMRQPTGMQCGKGYTELQFVFRGDGSLAEQKELNSFFIPCE
jgi:hypothetical protein